MTEQDKSTSIASSFPPLLRLEDATILRELLHLANIEIAASLQRIQSSREESDRLAAQSEVVMSKLRADWL